MAGKYDVEAQDALEMIAEAGGTATFARQAAPVSRDPVTGAETGGEPLSFALPAVGFPPGKSAESKIGSTANRKLIQLYVALKGSDHLPEEKDSATYGGRAYRVIHVTIYDPAADGPILAVVYGEV